MQKAIENNVFMCLVKSIDYICLHNQLHPLGNVAEICYTVEGVNTVSNVYETAIVEKRNVLNELRSNNMTLQELRFFSIYLSRINPWDVSTRVVRFPLSDFQRILGIWRMNMQHIRARIDGCLTISCRCHDRFTLFPKIRIYLHPLLPRRIKDNLTSTKIKSYFISHNPDFPSNFNTQANPVRGRQDTAADW